MRLVPKLTLAGFALLFGPHGPIAAQQSPLTPADYGQWERLGSFDLDPSGRWLSSAITRVNGTTELRVRATDGEGEEIVLEYGSGAVFGNDGRWMAFRKGVSLADEEAASEAGERIEDRLGLVDLTARADTVLFDVSGFSFRDDGRWLAAHAVAPSDSVGGALIVMDPSSGTQTIIGNVDEFAWQDKGTLLAATLRTAWGTSNGVVLFDPDANTLRTLETADSEYVGLTWREGSDQLAVLRSRSGDDQDDPRHDVLVWDDARGGSARVLEGVGREDLSSDLRITDFAGIRFAEGGRTLFVGVRPWEELADTTSETPVGIESVDDTDTEDADAVAPADVQVWHWDDDQVLRAQEYRAVQIARQTMTVAWHIDRDRLVVLGDDLGEPVEIVDGGRWGIVPDYDPYLFERRFGAGTADWYRIDSATGERALVAQGLEFGIQSDFDGGQLLAYVDDRWVGFEVEDLERTPIGDPMYFTKSLRDHDYPGPRPSWGVGGWVDGGSAALLYDKHDVWLADLERGSIDRLTTGAEQGREYRVVNLDPTASQFATPLVDPEEDVWLAVRDLRTKESGYARMELGSAPQTVLFEEARVSGLRAARDVDRFAIRVERWDDSPDVFVGDASLSDLTQATETNPFQDEFVWGKAELLDYTTDAGHDLQAILVYPADFREGKQYPLILYQYELLSDNLHVYDVPSERDYYNYQAWSQAGYFVLMPDIVYEPGRPGPSALDAVEHALDAAVATGHVDADGMGLIGHSWGGYQASYLPTRTHRFGASVAGAAITNFMSFMGAVHWNGGLPETGHWETGQARMASPYWDTMEEHLESSPANFITNLETPVLLMHGDADGVVDFRQGLEFYNYARRAGKEVVLLAYPGADHGLSEETQQVDYHRRILEWFGHYLKGDPAQRWIAEGENWVEREKRVGG